MAGEPQSHCLTPTCALALRPCTEEQCWDPQRQVKLQIQENTFTWRTRCVTTPPLMNSIGMQLEMKLIPGILIAPSSSTQVLIFTFEISASVAEQRSQHTNCSSVTDVASHLSKPYFTFGWEAFQAMHLLHCRHSLCLQFIVLLESSYCTEQV